MADKRYVLALDQGTTSSRSIVFDARGTAAASSQEEIRQLFPEPGLVEHDPAEILSTQITTASEALDAARLTAGDIASIGITNQRETSLLWDPESGQPIGNAIVWQDRRTSGFCAGIREKHGRLIKARTGLEVDPYFSASKIRWMLDNIPGARGKAAAGDLLFGTVDTWLIWNLTGGDAHVTDVSNASRTMLFDIRRLRWDEELLAIFDIPVSVLPEVISSSGICGEVSVQGPLQGIEIHGIAGDQQAALFGQRCFQPGEMKNTYGTGCFLLQNTGTEPSVSRNRLLTTVGWQVGDETVYALEGSVFIGGALVQWLRDSLQMIGAAGEIEDLARTVRDNGGVFFVPAFAGLGAPYWDPDARGTMIGLTRGTGRGHIARAAIEAIAFQTAELAAAAEADSGKKLSRLRVAGGACANDLLLQFQADLLQVPVSRSGKQETTALGAAFLAGLSSGVWRDQEELREIGDEQSRFDPRMAASAARDLLAKWREAVQRSLKWEAGPRA